MTKSPIKNKEQQVALQNWVYLNALIIFVGFIIYILTDLYFVLIVASIAAFSVLFFKHGRKFNKQTIYTVANFITAFRWLVISFATINVLYLSNWTLFFCFGLVILLDGIDGWIARKNKEESDFGALFDKVTDAFLVLNMTIIIIESYHLHFWLLSLGLLHYGYEILIHLLGWSELKTPKNPIGKISAVLLFLSLLSAFILKSAIISILLPFTALVTITSFVISFWYKWKVAKKVG